MYGKDKKNLRSLWQDDEDGSSASSSDWDDSGIPDGDPWRDHNNKRLQEGVERASMEMDETSSHFQEKPLTDKGELHTIEIHHHQGISVKSLAFSYVDGDIAAKIKAHYLAKFDREIQLFSTPDMHDDSAIPDSVLISDLRHISMVTRVGFEAGEDEEGKQWSFLRTLYETQYKKAMNEAREGRGAEEVFDTHPNDPGGIHKHMFRSKCVEGAVESVDQKQQLVAEHLSFLMSKEMVSNFWRPEHPIGNKAVKEIQKEQLTTDESKKFEDCLLSEVYPHIFQVVDLPHLFALIDILKGKHVVINNTVHLFASDGLDSEEGKEDEFVEGGDSGSFKWPWEREVSTEVFTRTRKVASILTNLFPIGQQTHRGKALCRTYQRVSMPLFRASMPRDAIIEMQSRYDQIKSKTFSYDKKAGYIKSLRFLFNHCLQIVKDKMIMASYKHVVSMKGNPFIRPGLMHINGAGEDEVAFSDEFVDYAHVRSFPDGSFQRQLNPFAPDRSFLSRDVKLPIMKVWPRCALGLVTCDLGNDHYLVQLFTDDEQKAVRESLAIWAHNAGSKVSPCSLDMTCNFTSCMDCGRVKFSERCICASISLGKFVPSYEVFYESESFCIPFKLGQIVYFYVSAERGNSKKLKRSKSCTTYISAIKGTQLILRVVGRSTMTERIEEERQAEYTIDKRQRLAVHFADPRIEVPLQGDSVNINDLKIYIFVGRPGPGNYMQSNTPRWAYYKLEHISALTDSICTKCKKGPKSSSHGCNFCGYVQLGVKAEMGFEGRKLFSSFQTEEEKYCDLIGEIKRLYSQVCNGDLLICNGSGDFNLPRRDNIKEANEWHKHISGCVFVRQGLVTISDPQRGVRVCVGKELHEKLVKADNMWFQLKFARDTQNGDFCGKMPTWVPDDAPAFLLEKRDKQIKEVIQKSRSLTKNMLSVSHLRAKLADMRSANSIVASDLTKMACLHLFADQSFPLCAMSTPVTGRCFETERTFCYFAESEQPTEGPLLTTSVFYTFSLRHGHSVCACMEMNSAQPLNFKCKTWLDRLSSIDYKSRGKGAVKRSVKCAGPFLGIAENTHANIMRILKHTDGRSCASGAAIDILCVIHESLPPLEQSELGVKRSVGDSTIVLYMFLMYSWYATHSDIVAISALVDTDVLGCAWLSAFLVDPHESFWEHFYEIYVPRKSTEVSKRARVAFTLPDDLDGRLIRAQCIVTSLFTQNRGDGKQIPEKITINQFAERRLRDLTGSFPYTGKKKCQVGEGGAFFWKETAAEDGPKLLEASNETPEEICDYVWRSIPILAGTGCQCRSHEDFLFLLDRVEKRQSFSTTSCGDKRCKQCKILSMLRLIVYDQSEKKRSEQNRLSSLHQSLYEAQLHPDGNDDQVTGASNNEASTNEERWRKTVGDEVDKVWLELLRDAEFYAGRPLQMKTGQTVTLPDYFRAVKSVVGGESYWADMQLETFGEIVSFGVCPHQKYIQMCKICMKEMDPCRRDHMCVTREGKRMCKEQFVFFHASNGTCIPCSDGSQICKYLRHLNARRSEQEYSPVVTSAQCDAMMFYHAGSSVVRFSDMDIF